MSLSTPFIHRPVATTLLTVAVALAGALAYFFLPVSPLPQVDYPSVSVSAGLPGASPETMASAVATPLERQFGRIAGVTEMTSSSTLGSTNITLVFDLNRDIDAAARDTQAAINAAAGNLPANLPSKPNYRKINPADAPIMILTMTSDVYDKAHMYDTASSILAQKLAQVQGVGQVNVGGSALPSVRVEVNPTLLNNFGLGLEDVRTVLAAANANRPKGQIAGANGTFTLNTTDQLFDANHYRSLLIAFRNGAPVRVGDVADVVDSVEDIRQMGLTSVVEKNKQTGQNTKVLKGAVLLIIFRQPGANIISTVDAINKLMPLLQASIPPTVHLGIGLDRTQTIRASVRDVEVTLLISIGLVIMVVFIFLRDWRATLIPSVAVPVSLIGTFAVMYLLNYSLDNLSLMALTIATGFVVDDAIVVVENISRHIEDGIAPLQAALKGAEEIGFTVLSISVSLVAVFIPILLMGGYIGRLFREFAVTLSVAIFVSMLVSLTTTPMMAAVLLRAKGRHKPGRLFTAMEKVDQWILGLYERGLRCVLHHQPLMLFVTIATIALTVYLFFEIPKGFFPQQDTGRISGSLKADQATSFQAMSKRLEQFAGIVAQDPNVDTILAFSGGRGAFNQAQMFGTLEPNEKRKLTVDQVLAQLRQKTGRMAGASLIFQPVQDIRIGGRGASAQYQYTLQGDDLAELNTWAPKLAAKMKTMGNVVTDIDSDQQIGGLQADLTIDRATAARLGITSQQIDQTLYDAFGQEQVSTMYTQLNQYHVVMEVNSSFWQNPDGLKYLYVKGNGGVQVPLSAFTSYKADNTPLAVNHTGQFPSITISFNLLPGVSLGDAVADIENASRDIGMPADIHAKFAGTAQAYQDSLGNMQLLIAAAILTVYIVLGVLYESLIHPVTILSTLPSAGVGALLALLAMRTDLTVIADIGIILLIGIVKKNAIMMIDFALDAERTQGKSPEQAILQAAVLRFRPITMTTMAALLGGLPLAIGGGTGSELRTPLGIAIVGGLLFSQMLTLFTTPVIYLYMDRLSVWLGGKAGGKKPVWNQPLAAGV